MPVYKHVAITGYFLHHWTLLAIRAPKQWNTTRTNEICSGGAGLLSHCHQFEGGVVAATMSRMGESEWGRRKRMG
jgi:hypothetical protein